jgi:hypothetical protein
MTWWNGFWIGFAVATILNLLISLLAQWWYERHQPPKELRDEFFK